MMQRQFRVLGHQKEMVLLSSGFFDGLIQFGIAGVGREQCVKRGFQAGSFFRGGLLAIGQDLVVMVPKPFQKISQLVAMEGHDRDLLIERSARVDPTQHHLASSPGSAS